MSQENVELVRGLYERIDQDGWEAAFATGGLDPDCELIFVAGPQAGTHRGTEQIRVVVTHHNRLRPKGGDGGELEYRNGFVYTISDGLIVSAVGYPTPAEALEAAGLPK